MVFKLVRTDTEDPCKIQLPVGIHVFGRGVFLDCEDKRVSRKHGQLSVTADTVTLTALHQNPCFYVKKGSEETGILRQDGSATLCNGDKFGLLPSAYWYELLLCTLSPDIISKPPENMPNGTENEVRNVQTNQDNKEESEVNQINRNGEINEELEESTLLDFELNDTIENLERPESPSLIVANPVPSEDQSSTNQTKDYQQVASPNKRSLPDASDPEDVKRIKTEPIDSNATVGNAQAGPSNPDQRVKDESPPSPVKPAINPGPSRERCWYGAHCYRRNPLHKADFSHPSDVDWGSGPRAPCPFGAGCTKRDPRHWRDHEHPPSAQQPARPGRRKKPRIKKQKRNSESDEDTDDSPTPDVNLPAKRARKTIKRPSYSGSESENEYDLEDPFLTDDEDDWVPPDPFLTDDEDDWVPPTSQSQSQDY